MEFLTPKNLPDALDLIDKYPAYKILAGGTDICVGINGGAVKSAGLISIWGIPEISGIKDTGDHIEIGAATTHTKIINNESLRKFVPALVAACKTIGARQIQNRGTIGGNVMNASPAGDTLPVLLAYEAVIEAARKGGKRLIDFERFYGGYRKTMLSENEMITKIIIPKAQTNERAAFLKIGTRRAQAISKVMGCFRVIMEAPGEKDAKISEAFIAYGSVAPVPVRLPKTEALLNGLSLTKDTIEQAVLSARAEIQPIDDVRSTAEYRRHTAGIMLKRFLEDKP